MKREIILTAIIIVNLLISGIFVGAPIEETHRPIILITMLLCFVYVILSKYKIKMIRNKVDIFVLFLIASTAIPLIAGTAVSITSGINHIFKYISAFLIYIFIREHTINYPNSKKQIINTLIFISVILVLLGIDNLSLQIFKEPLKLIDIEIKEIEKNRLSSVFCYANALAIVIGISIILNNVNYLNEQNRIKKSLYGTITVFLMMGLLLTYSRLAMLFIAVFILFYVILLKNKIKAYDIIKLMIISTIISYIYSSIFFNFINNEQYILLWLITIAVIAASFAMIYVGVGIEKKLEKIKIKNILIILSVGIVLLIGIVLIFKGNLNVFKNGRKQYELQVGNIKANEEYIMNFDFEEIKIDEAKNNFKIEVVEMDEFFDEIYTTEIDEKEFLNNKQIKIKMQDTTDKIKIVYTQINENCKIIISKLTINEKNKVLDYKLIPDVLEERIQNTLMSQKGLTERKVFIEDGLKLIKDNWLLGKGGNAWEYEQYNYQQYFYMATQVHSYIIQLGIEYGIIAMISFSIIIILIIRKYVTNKDNNIEQITITVAIMLLLAHSFIDFDMTYLYILQLFFVLLAMLFSYNQIVETQKAVGRKVILACILSVVAISYIVFRPYYDSNIYKENIKKWSNLYYKLDKENKQRQQIDKKIIKEYQKYFELEKHYIINTNDYFNYAHVIQRNMNDENIEETVKELNFIYDIAKKMQPNYGLTYRFIKYEECKLIADKLRLSKIQNEELKKVQEKYYNLVLEELEQFKKSIEEEYKLYRISKEKSEVNLERIEEMKSDILEAMGKTN